MQDVSKDSPAFVLTFLPNAGRMWKISPNSKENKLIVQGLADIRQRETPTMCIIQIRYPCLAFAFHSQHIRKIRNGICKHFLAFVKQIC